jgi:D-alanyl-D-alanine carboxypeptidase (penicillin-binding protein 5/6)
MIKNLILLFTSLLISFPFWWGINIFHKRIENFFFWQEIAKNPNFLLAQVSQEINLEKLKPIIRKEKSEDLDIKAKAALALFINRKGEEKILFDKNSEESLPIASLTKIMTAHVFLKNYNIHNPEIANLFYSLLIASDNEAAMKLARLIGEEKFVELMNKEAKNLGLKRTRFFNPSGLDPFPFSSSFNYSTAQDLAKLAFYLLENQPLIWEISKISELDIYSAEGIFQRRIKNTNELLEKIPEIIGGKTGETPNSKGSLLLILKAPKNKGYLITVILGSENRFLEMEELINWLKTAYQW